MTIVPNHLSGGQPDCICRYDADQVRHEPARDARAGRGSSSGRMPGLMPGPDLLLRGAPGFSLPAFDRLAPAPSPELIGARIEALTAPGDVVIDLFGRGGWVARAALDRQRRACSFESTPLTRLLAEVVLRPPDIRHLDAAFQVIATSPHGDRGLKAALGDLF